MRPLLPSPAPTPTSIPDHSAAPPRQRAGATAGTPNSQSAGNTPLRRLAGLLFRRAAAGNLAKPLVATLMVLAVAASVVLAVALPEPTPADAQTNMVTLRVENGDGGTQSAVQLGLAYTLKPVNCTGVSNVATITQADGANDGSATASISLDTRCNWEVRFCHVGTATLYENPAAEGGSPDIFGNAADPNVFMLTKSSGKLVWAEAADMDDRVKQVDVISYADPAPCYQTIDVETGRAFSYPPPEGFEYRLTPENCDSGFTTTVQTMSDAASTRGNGMRDGVTVPNSWDGHQLDTRCDWAVEFCEDTGLIGLSYAVGDTSSQVTGPGNTISGSEVFKLTRNSDKQLIWEPGMQTDEDGNLVRVVNKIQYSNAAPCVRAVDVKVGPASGTNSAVDDSTRYTLNRRNCPQTGFALPTANFTQASGTEVMENGAGTGAKIHQLDYRCDWQVWFCGAEVDVVFADGTKVRELPGSRFILRSDAAAERLVYGPYDKSVASLEFGAPFGCDTTELQVRSAQRNVHDISILRSGVFFVMVPVNCGTGTGGRQVSAAPVTVLDYSGILDSGDVGQYALDSRCGWRFYACDIPNTPSIQFYDLAGNRNVGSAASPTAMDVELTRHSSGKWGRGGSAFDFMLFNMPSVDISNQPVAANLNRCPAAHAQATTTVRVGRAAGVDTFAGLDYELAPVNCVFNDPATAPPPAQTNATTGTGGNTDMFKTHQLDVRCDWLARFCGSPVQVGNRASDGMVTEHATLAHGEVFLLAKQLSNRALAYPGSAQSDKTANYFEVSEELGCADTEVQVAAAMGVAAKAFSQVSYNLVPRGCRNVNAGGVALTGGATLTLTTQTRLSGFPASGGALAHKLDVRCDWNIQFCTAGAKIGAATPGEGTPFGTVATAGGAFKLDGYLQRGFAGTVLRLQYEAATAAGDRTKAVDRLWVTSPSTAECPDTGSSEPELDLAAASDSGSSDADNITNDDTPTFEVSNIDVVNETDGSTVTVTATKGTDTVSQAKTVTTGNTSATFEFTGSACTKNNSAAADQSCTLDEGTWSVVANHNDNENDATDSSTLTLKVDKTGPSVTLSSDVAEIAATGAGNTATITFTTSEDAADFATKLASITRNANIAELSNLAGSGSSYTATLTGVAVGTSTISVPADTFTDLAGNGNAAPDSTVDPPTGTLSVTVVAQAPSKKPTVALTAATDLGTEDDDGITNTHNSNVPTLDVTDLVAGASVTITATQQGGSGSVTKTIASLSGTRITFPFSGNDCNPGDESCALGEGTWKVKATHTESGKADTDSDELTIVIDNTAPSVTALTASPTSIVARGATTATLTITLSENSAGFAPSSITATPTNTPANSATAVLTRNSFPAAPGTTYKVNFTATAPDTYTLSVPANIFTDTAGNSNTASASGATATVMVTAPDASATPTITYTGEDTGSEPDDSYTKDTTPSFTVSGVVAGSVVTVTATKSNEGGAPTVVFQTVPGNLVTGTSVDVDFTGRICGAGRNQDCALGEGTWNITATHTESGKAPTTASAMEPLTIDTTPPTLTMSITDDQTSLPIGATPTITFSSGRLGIADFVIGDVTSSDTGVATVTVAAGDSFPATGRTFTATVEAVAEGTTTISVPAGAFTDLAGNANTEAPEPLEITVVSATTAAPTITSPAADATLLSGFEVTGTAPAGSTVTVTMGASPNTVTETTTATPGGNWSVVLTSTTLTGAQSISVKAKTAAQADSTAVTRSVTLATSPVPSSSNTTPIVMSNAGFSAFPSVIGISYLLDPVNCNSGAEPMAQTEANGAPRSDSKGVTHNLDYRCEWQVTLSHTHDCTMTYDLFGDDISQGMSGSRKLTAISINPRGNSTKNTFVLNKNVAQAGPTYNVTLNGVPVIHRLTRVYIGVNDAINECRTPLIVTAGDGSLDLENLEGKNLNYRMRPNPQRCSGPDFEQHGGAGGSESGNGSDQSRRAATSRMEDRDGTSVTIKEYKQELDPRCNWQLAFIGSTTVANKCLSFEFGYVSPGDAEADIVIYGSRTGLARFAPSPLNNQLLWADSTAAEKPPVNRLRITYIDQTITVDGEEVHQCTTPVTFSSRTGEREAGVSFSVATGRNRRACTPNSRSVAVDDLPAMLASVSSQTYELGNNCNWLVTFGSENPNCAATAYFVKLTGDGSRELHSLHKVPVDSYPRGEDNEKYKANVTKTFPFYVKARPGDTANFRLTGKADGMYLSLPENEGGEVKITEVTFTSCALPQGYARIAVVDDVGGGMDLEDVNLTYTFEPTACIGQGLPATQTNADAIEDMEQVAGNQDVRVHFLNYFCSWEVSYSIPNDCQVTPTLRSTNLIPYSTAVHLPTQYGGFKMEPHIPRAELQYNGDDKISTGLVNIGYIAFATDTGARKCGTSVTLNNTATAGGSKAVKVTLTPKMPGATTMPCAAPAGSWVPYPTDPVVIPENSSLEVTLAAACDWDFTVDPVESHCKATVEIKEADDTDILNMPREIAAGGTWNFALIGANDGLKQGVSPNIKTVAYVDINACSAIMEPANTQQITVVNNTGPHPISYEFTQSGCSNSAAPTEVTQADAYIDGNNYIHFLDVRCSWSFEGVWAFQTPSPCSVTVDIKDANDRTLHTTNSITFDGRPVGAPTMITYRDDEVATVEISLDTSSLGCLALVNKSTPFGYTQVDDPDDILDLLPATRGTPAAPATEVIEFDRPFPQVVVNVVPHNNGAACTPSGAGGFTPGPGKTGTIPAGVVNSDDTPLNYNPGSLSYALGKNCDWEIEFISSTGMENFSVDGQAAPGLICFKAPKPPAPPAPSECTELDTDELVCLTAAAPPAQPVMPVNCGPGDETLVCSASAQVLSPTGTEIGAPVGGSALLGGSLNLAWGSTGFTYTPAGGTATAVGSIEFIGCLAAEYPGSSEFQIFDDAGAVDDFTYTIAPAEVERPLTAQEIADGDTVAYETTCDGFTPPDSQTKSDGVVFEEGAGVYTHYLNHSCDWDVTFTGTQECEAVTLWSFNENGLEFVETVTDATQSQTDGRTITVRLTQFLSHQLDDDGAGADRTTQQAQQDGEVYDALNAGFVYYRGSGNRGQVDASSGSGVPGSGAPDAPAPAAVNAITLECASDLEVEHFPNINTAVEVPITDSRQAQASALGTTQLVELLGMEVSATTPAIPSDSPTAPTCSTQNRLGHTSELTASDAAFTLALNNKCDWNLEFKSADPSCVAGARALDRFGELLGTGAVQPAAGTAGTLALTRNVAGLRHGTGQSEGQVAAIEFVNCFSPDLTVQAVSIAANTEFTIALAALGAKEGCTTDVSLALVAGADGVATLKSGTSLPLLAGLAADGTLCEYTAASAAGSAAGVLAGGATKLSVHENRAHLVVKPAIEVVLANKTQASGGSLSADQRKVRVTVRKSSSCSESLPAGSPFTLEPSGATQTINLGAQECQWAFDFANTAGDCTVSAQPHFETSTTGLEAQTDGTVIVSTTDSPAQGADRAKRITGIDFTVGSCGTIFPAEFELTIRDSDSTADHSAARVTVSVAKTSTSPATGCSVVPDITLSQATPSVTRNLVQRPNGASADCEYMVTFSPASITSGAVTLNLVGSPTETIKAAAGGGTVEVSRTYRAVREPAVTLENKTSASATYPQAGMSSVVVTPGSGCGVAATPINLDTASNDSQTVTLGTSNCSWTFTFKNTNSDCEVTAQPIGTDGTSTVGAAATSTSSGPGSLTLGNDGSAVKRGRIEVGSVRFTVAAPDSGDCSTYFNGTLEAEADDSTANHDNTTLTATITQDTAAGCSKTADLGGTNGSHTLTLGANSAAMNTASASVGQLVGTPWGGTACSYAVTFDPSVASKGAGVSGVNLRRTATDPTSSALSFTAQTVKATYAPAKAGTVNLNNVTTEANQSHPNPNWRNVALTLSSSSTCDDSLPRDELDLYNESSPTTVTFANTECTWSFTFGNQHSNCQVTAELVGPAPGNAMVSTVTSKASTNGTGTITLYVDVVGNTKLLNNSGAEVALVKFTVAGYGNSATCATVFPATLEAEVEDPNRNHDNSVLTAKIAVGATGCTQASGLDRSYSMVLGEGSAAMNTGSVSLPRLIDTPWGGTTPCSYAVTFDSPVASTGMGISGVELELKSVTPAALSGSARTVKAVYEATTAATVDLRNVTNPSGGSLTSSQREVVVDPTSGCGATNDVRLVAGTGARTVTLGRADCDWVIAYANVAGDCQVSAQFKDSSDADIDSNGAAAGTADTDGTLTLYARGRKTMSAPTGGSEVATVEFTATETCDTTFDVRFRVTVADPENASHENSAIPVPVSSTQSYCSDDMTATVSLPAPTISSPSSGSLTNATASLTGLIKKRWNQNSCQYKAVFPPSVASTAGTDVQLRFGAGGNERSITPDPADMAVTVSADYVASRAAALHLSNATAADSSHSPATRRNVVVTPGAGTCVADPSSIPTLTAVGATQSVTLGTADCTWSLSFSNPDSDCVVSAQPMGASGTAGSAVRAVSGTLQFSVDGDDREVSYGGQVVTSVAFTVTSDCDATFNGTVSVTANDTISATNHAGTTINVSVASTSGVGCSSPSSVSVSLAANGTAATRSTGNLVAKKAGTAECVYAVSFPSSQTSAVNPRFRLVRSTAASVAISSASSAAAATYTAERIPDPPVLVVSVSSAGSVTEGQPLVFRAGMLGPAVQPVELGYSVSGLGDTVTGTATIDPGQTATEISVPTDNNERDDADRTVRVTLTSATGGATIDPAGSTATGIVKDNDDPPVASLDTASVSGNRLRFTVRLSEPSGREVRANYITSVGSGVAVIRAGRQSIATTLEFDSARLRDASPLNVRLTAAQNATLDLANRERNVLPGGRTWQFHVVSRDGTQPRQIVASLGFDSGWSIYSWSDTAQRWVEHTATSRATTPLAAGTTIVYRGSDSSEADLQAAGLGRTSSVTFNQGWNIFTPAPEAIGLGSRDFTRIPGGGNAVFFDPMLIDCARLAGVLVIYTYDQTDIRAANGFRVALPCHPQLEATLDIPAITSIDANDTIYAYFYSTTPVTLEFQDGRYSPA